jgi:hypothetical protein
MISPERFGANADPDGDGFVNEMTVADVTAVSVFQAVMAVPGRVIPNDPEIEAAVLLGEQRFSAIGCASCHRPTLPLDTRLAGVSIRPRIGPAGAIAQRRLNAPCEVARGYSVQAAASPGSNSGV